MKLALMMGDIEVGGDLNDVQQKMWTRIETGNAALAISSTTIKSNESEHMVSLKPDIGVATSGWKRLVENWPCLL